MRKIIAAFNMTLDGICDHTAMMPDEEIHEHYNELLSSADAILYGRITYQLMESYWPSIVKNPTGSKMIDQFAVIIDHIPKTVFSHTLQQVDWKNARLAKQELKDEILSLREEDGKDILIGSRSIIVAALNLGLIDELQLTVFPAIAAKGLLFFQNIHDKINLQLTSTKTFECGAITSYFSPIKTHR